MHVINELAGLSKVKEKSIQGSILDTHIILSAVNKHFKWDYVFIFNRAEAPPVVIRKTYEERL